MCPLCEEPVRSVLIGLAAIGLVWIVRAAQRGVKRLMSKSAQKKDARVEAVVRPDSVP